MDKERFILEIITEIGKILNLSLENKKELFPCIDNFLRNYEVTYAEESPNKSFKYYIDMYVEVSLLEGLSPNTIKNRTYTLNEIDKFLNKDIKSITVSDLRYYLRTKSETVVSTTVNNLIRTISSFFGFLYRDGYIDRDISKSLRKVKEPSPLIKIPNSIETEILRNSCKDTRDRALFEFILSSGMRPSEVSKLNISDLDFSANTLRVIGKGNVEMIKMFSDTAKYYLSLYLKERKDTNDSLFVGCRKPYGRLSVRAIEKILCNIQKRAGVDVKITPRNLRHTMATNLVESGAELSTVQFLLGHKNISTTQIYAKTSYNKVRFEYSQLV